MNIQEILGSVDHTDLRVGATWKDIKELCDHAIKYQTASVCIPPSFVKQAFDYVAQQMVICTVVGFPNGYNTTAAKVYEIQDAIRNGAKEIDIVINNGWVKDKRYDLILEELKKARKTCKGLILKVIVETCLLSREEKIEISKIVTDSGADFIKTSTGFSVHGATIEDVTILLEHVGKGVKCKASGGIKSLEDADEYIKLGVQRLGTSSVIKEVMEREKINE